MKLNIELSSCIGLNCFTGVNTDRLEHSARSFRADLPLV